MSTIITKQPNGKWARYSSVRDTFTHINMSEDELYEYMKKEFGANDEDVVDFKGFLAGQHSFKPEDFYEVIENLAITNETLESLRQKLADMGMRNADNFWPAVTYEEQRKEQAKWLMKEISKYMSRYGFWLTVENEKIYLTDEMLSDEEGGWGKEAFKFDNVAQMENFY